MNLNFLTFQGILPKINDRLLVESQATKAQDVDLTGGILGAIAEPGSEDVLDDEDRISIFPYNSNWLSWTTDVDVVRSPVFDDDYDRIYYTGDGSPKVRGTDASVEYAYDLGVPAPTASPTVAAAAKASITWTPTWYYQYENPNTGVVSVGPTAITMTETTPGKEYTCTIATGVGEGASDVFVLFFDAENAAESDLGRLYADISFYSDGNNDFYLQGAEGRGTQTNVLTVATFIIDYETSRASDYKVDRVYKYAFVTGWGEIGAMSDESIVVTVDPTQDCAISGLETSTTGTRNITHKNIYRTATTDAGEYFFFVKQVTIATTSTTDDVDGEDIGEQAPTVDYDPPPSDLAGLVALPGGFMAAFTGKTVYLCEPDHPEAWPEDYALTVEYDIVGLGVNSSGLVVLTTGLPELMTGLHPNSMSQYTLDTRQACVSKRSIAIINDDKGGPSAVAYASPDGIIIVPGGTPYLATDNFYKKKQWTLLTPSSMISEVHDSKYYGFADGGNIIFDIGSGDSGLTTTEQECTGIYSDLETDTLYLIQEDEITSWLGGDDNLTLEWKSRDIITTKPVAPSVARVRAASVNDGEVTLIIYVNGTEVVSTNVRTQKAFKLPTIRVGTKWALEIQSTVDVYEALLSNSMAEL